MNDPSILTERKELDRNPFCLSVEEELVSVRFTKPLQEVEKGAIDLNSKR